MPFEWHLFWRRRKKATSLSPAAAVQLLKVISVPVLTQKLGDEAIHTMRISLRRLDHSPKGPKRCIKSNLPRTILRILKLINWRDYGGDADRRRAAKLARDLPLSADPHNHCKTNGVLDFRF